ncbi:MAG: Calx-beta domain-containing protein, partial [Candidatus Eisenbacteria bacterium]
MRLVSLSHLALAFALTFAPARVLSAEYHWNAVVSAGWSAPGSWTPARVTPLATDRLVFDGGGVSAVTGVPVATIGQMDVSNGTQITFSPSVSGNAITIGGDTGTDVTIAAGSSLNLAGTNTISINLAAGATASVAGTLTAAGGPHRFSARDADAIQILAGGKAKTLTGFGGSLFGPGSGFNTPNSVRFQSGSVFAQGAGSNPFGLSQPASIVMFDHGSLYQVNPAVDLSLSGRTLANLEYNGSGTSNTTGSADCTIDSIVVNSGTLNLAMTSTVSIRGSIRVRSNGVLNLGPTSGSVTYRLNGVATQVLADSSTVPSGSFYPAGLVLTPAVTVVVDNPAGVTLDPKLWRLFVPGTLQFASGVMSTPGYSAVRLGTTGSITGASAGTGWVSGLVEFELLPSAPSRTLPTGTATEFAPIDLMFHAVTDTVLVLGGTFVEGPETPNYFDGSQLDTLKNVNLAYALLIPDSTAWGSFDAVLHFNAADIDAGADPNQFVARSRFIGYAGAPLTWRSAVTTTRTPTTIDAIGVTRARPSDYSFAFAVGVPTQVHISALDVSRAEDTGAMPFRIKLSEPSVDAVSMHYQTADGSALAGADYTATSGNFVLAPGATEYVVTVPIVVDSVPEPDETFSLVLSNPMNAVIDKGTAIGTILDDDDVTPPVAQVLYPNGGETIIEGSIVNLLWSATDNVVVVGVNLSYSVDDGANYTPIASALANTGSYAWTVPTGLTHLARLKVVASDQHALTGQDVSDAAWSIWGVNAVAPVLPTAFAFDVASGNPSLVGTRLRYALPQEQHVRLTMLDARGRLVATLVDGLE